jgi:hypothetical protein
MQGRTTQEFQVLRVFDPALKMKAETYSSRRCQKNTCQEFNCREEKRKSAY